MKTTHALVLLCVACGPYAPPVSSPETTSVALPAPPIEHATARTVEAPAPVNYETRLKPLYSTMVTTGKDGSSHTSERFAGWFDTQRNEPCKPMRAEDGKMRCLPDFVEASASYYVDAKCSKPVVLVTSASGSCDEPAPVPKYFALPFVAASCSLVTIAPLGPKIEAASWYKKTGNTCMSLGRAPATLDFYDASQKPLSPTEFVEMSISSSSTTP